VSKKKKGGLDVVIDDQTPLEPEEKGEQGGQPTAQSEGERPEGIQIDMEALRAEVAGIIKERDEAVERVKYVSADFDNYKKRMATARTDAASEATRAAVAAFLPAMDSLERALTAAQGGESGALVAGVDMVLKQMGKALGNLGVEEIVTQCGDAFDPGLHNAVVTVPADDEHGDNTVFDTLQKGYKQGDKVIRYAMVRVAKED
jgi:molecular chaperone GrpE